MGGASFFNSFLNFDAAFNTDTPTMNLRSFSVRGTSVTVSPGAGGSGDVATSAASSAGASAGAFSAAGAPSNWSVSRSASSSSPPAGEDC